MKRYDVITFGSATRDVFLQSDRFRSVRDASSPTRQALLLPLGTKMDMSDVQFETGGGATNTAVGFARLGLSTAAVARIGKGDARGAVIRRTLEDEGVDTRFIAEDPKHGTAYSVLLLTRRGERTVLVHRGASADFRERNIPFSKIAKTKWFYITALGGNIRLLKKLVRFANTRGIRVALNPGQAEIAQGYKALKGILAGTSVLFLNREEAARLTGLPYEQDTRMFERMCIGLPGVVVITEGRRGALVCDNEKKYLARTHNVKVTDTTGAGDAFGCGFLAGYIHARGDIPYALQVGVENAESVIQRIAAKPGLLKRFPKKKRGAVRTIDFPNP
jgi:ribokinase